MKHPKHPLFAAMLAAAALLATGGCNLGEPIRTSGPTEVEGLTGTLVAPNGSPAAGAWVKVYAAPATGLAKGAVGTVSTATFGPAVDSIQTNASGSFSLKGLGDGTYNVAAFGQRNDTTLALFLRGVIVVGDTDLGVDTLRVSGDLLVRLSAGGNPLAGALCFVAASPWSAVSDAQGDCKLLGVPPGEFRISVSYSGDIVIDVGDITMSSGGSDSVSVPLPPAGAPQAPVQLFPGPNDFNVTLIPNMSWNRIHNAGSYTLLLSTDSSFSTGVLTYEVPQPALMDTLPLDTLVWKQTDSLQQGTTYYWKVRASNSAGSSLYSPIRRFTTRLINPPPTVPVPFIPVHGATGVSTTPTLVWNAVPGAIAYHVQLSTDSAFLTGVWISDSTSTPDTSHVVASLAQGATYFWRVRALSPAPGGWSNTRHFTTGGILLSPAQVLPAPGATVYYGNVLIRWRAVSDAAKYRLQVAEDSAFTTLALDTSSTDTSVVTGFPPPGTTYYWRVRSENGSGQGSYSVTRKFSTTTTHPDSMLGMPTLLIPSYGDTNVARPATLSWEALQGATGYQVQVATDSAFTSGLQHDTLVTGTSTTVQLSSGTWYFWRVRGTANGQAPPWAAWSVFRTTP